MMTHTNTGTGDTERILVVAGGSSDPSTVLKSVELLFLDSLFAGRTDGWVFGPDLPNSAEHATMFTDEDGVVIVGGDKGLDGHSLFKLTPTSTSWEKLPQKLSSITRAHVSFLIPDEIANCFDPDLSSQ